MTPEPSNEYQKLVEAVARAEAWLRQCSDWLLATDLDMQCPMETDPLDIADALSALKLPHAGDDGLERASREAIALIDEINERAKSREFYGIDQVLHAKLCTIRATLVRPLPTPPAKGAPHA